MARGADVPSEMASHAVVEKKLIAAKVQGDGKLMVAFARHS
jgi:hypothetical protein